MIRAEAIFPALIAAFTAAMLALGHFHYHYAWTSFAFPFAVGLAVIALCGAEMLALLRSSKAVVDVPAVPIRSLLWLFALAPFLWAFGFVFGAALYLLISLRGHAFSWRASVTTALASLLVSWGLVIELLGVQLPIKPLWFG